MNLRAFCNSVRCRWQSTPAILRWNGGTLVVAGFVAATIHAISTGPAVSRADQSPSIAAMDLLPAAVQLKCDPTTQPARRNLFSLDWQRSKATASPATATDDPGFWNDVATPLKSKPTGGAR